MFKGKRILFFSANFFGYQFEIKNKLIELGAEVDFFDERPKNTFLYKALIRFNKRFITKIIEKYYRTIIEETKSKDYDFVFFLKAEVITPKVLRELQQTHKKAKFILYMWDSIDHFPLVRKLFPVFDKILSFDKEDVQANSFLHFRPLFYIDTYKQLPDKPETYENDITFIGTAHFDRYPVLMKLKEHCERHQIKYYFFIYLQDLKIYYIRKLLYKSFRKSKKSDFELKPLNKEEIKTIICNTTCVLDIEKTVQTGLTIRAIETFGARRKLITTNPKIREYDFYDDNNILIIDRDHPTIKSEFLTKEYQKADEEVYKKYSIEYWLYDIFK